MKDIKIFACPTAEEFTKEICDTLSLKMGRVECYKFANDNIQRNSKRTRYLFDTNNRTTS